MRGLLAATVVTSCADPELQTGLRPAGPPEVLSVVVYNDARRGPIETATYCKVGDAKVPTLVVLPDLTSTELCPGDGTAPPIVEDATPTRWYVRIQFDELLDPGVESLVPVDPDGPPCDSEDPRRLCEGHINTTRPVTLSCEGQDIDYDGYYVPNGNSITWPVGPNVTVIPTGYVATGSSCQIAIRPGAMFDKHGDEVPAEQRGPFSFAIAPLALVRTDPPAIEPPPVVASDATITLVFNGLMNEASFAGDVTMTDGSNPVADVVVKTAPADRSQVLVSSSTGLTPGATYTLTIRAGATVEDLAGGAFTFIDELNLRVTVAAP